MSSLIMEWLNLCMRCLAINQNTHWLLRASSIPGNGLIVLRTWTHLILTAILWSRCYYYPILQMRKLEQGRGWARSGSGGPRLPSPRSQGTTAAEPTFSSPMFILLLCHQILCLENSMWYILQKQKRGQIKRNYCSKQYSHPDRGCM